MATKKNPSQPDKTSKSRSTTKPRAIIEGSAEDVTPAGPKEKIKTESSATGKTRPTEKTAKPRPTPAGRQKKPGVHVLVATGLAASIATLAIIAVLVIISGPPRTWLARVSGADDAARLAREATSFARNSAVKLEKTVARQQSELVKLKAGLAASEAAGRQISQIRARLDGLEELATQTTALDLRIAAAEARLDTIAANAAARSQTVNSLARALDGAAKAGTSAEAVSAALALAISRLDDAESRLAKMSQDIEKLSQVPAPNDSQRRKTEARLAELARDVEALAARISSEKTDKLAASFDTLRQAIVAGRPYAGLLAPFGDSAVISKLAKYAMTGTPNIEGLKTGLAALPVNAPAKDRNEGTFGRLTSLLGQVVKVRRTDGTGGVEDPLATARQALDAGDPGRAADIVSQTAIGPDADAWVASARARADIDAALSELEALVALPSRKPGG